MGSAGQISVEMRRCMDSLIRGSARIVLNSSIPVEKAGGRQTILCYMLIFFLDVYFNAGKLYVSKRYIYIKEIHFLNVGKFNLYCLRCSPHSSLQ